LVLNWLEVNRKALRHRMLNTEAPSVRHAALDTYSTEALVEALLQDQARAAEAVMAASRAVATAVERALPRMLAGGRLIYVGAGTSGRLGAIDGVELNPTFSWPPERALSVLAGGQRAMLHAIEGAEDDADQGAADLRAVRPTADDVVILVAASGATPFVLGALAVARDAGALTIGMGNNVGAPVAAQADVGIILDTGPEVISGSTRLKAGTAQKIALNTFSSALMVRLNKVYGNLMVDLRATNAKLVRRAVALTMHATGCDETGATQALDACGYHVKTAVVAIAAHLSTEEARARLDAYGGNVRTALAQNP
jgi:N-acetylmuramic acid 6-phosphate etherase